MPQSSSQNTMQSFVFPLSKLIIAIKFDSAPLPKSSSSIPCGKGCHNNAVSHVCGIFLFLSPSFCIRQKRLWGGGDIISTAGEDEAEEVMTTIPWLMPKRELFSSSSGACVHYLSSFFFLRQQKERKILLLPCRLIFYPFLLL